MWIVFSIGTSSPNYSHPNISDRVKLSAQIINEEQLLSNFFLKITYHVSDLCFFTIQNDRRGNEVAGGGGDGGWCQSYGSRRSGFSWCLWGSKWQLLGDRCWGFSDGDGVDLGKGSWSLCLSPSHSLFLTPSPSVPCRFLSGLNILSLHHSRPCFFCSIF